MSTDEEILNQLEQTNSERQLLELQLEGQRYKRLRSVSGIQLKRETKVCSNDSIIFAGLKGTLGSRVRIGSRRRGGPHRFPRAWCAG